MASNNNSMDPLEAFLLVRQSILKIKDNGVLLGRCENWQDDLMIEEGLIPVFDALKTAMQQNKDSRVSCGGWVSVHEQDKKFKFQIRKNETDEFDEYDFMHLLPKKIIDEYCSPAPYGDIKKQRTVFDINVRSAFECSSNNFRLAPSAEKTSKPQKKKTKTSNSNTEKVDVPPSSHLHFLEQIQQNISSLADGRKIELVPYKLNIYQRGGFFKSHVDTPTDPKKMIGTLVICLPSFHQGGALVVKNKRSTEVYDFSRYSMDSTKIQYAALFSDCAHEVQPVTEGYRITVTYSIMVTEDNNNHNNNKANVDQTSKTESDFVELMNKIKMSPRKEVGIFLSHNYTLSAAEARNMKGLDKSLVDTALAQGLECVVLPVVHSVHEVKDEDELGSEMSSEVYAFTHADIKYLTGQGPLPVHNEVGEDIPFLITKSKGDLLQEHETGAENQGNWVEPGQVDRLYFNCAVVIRNNEWKEASSIAEETHNNNNDNTDKGSENNNNNNTKKNTLKRKLIAKKKK